MHNSKASLYLMELMISVLFFAISSVVCVQLFVKAHTVNQTTDIRTHAILAVQNTAEYFLSCNGDMEQTVSYYPESAIQNNMLTVYFNDKFAPCLEADSVYKETITFSDDSDYSYADIVFQDVKNKKDYYSLSLKKYKMKGGISNEED